MNHQSFETNFAHHVTPTGFSASRSSDSDGPAASFTPPLETILQKNPAENLPAAGVRSVLLITQYYPPEIGGGAQRSSGIAEGLQKCGIDVTVVAPFATYLMRDHERAASWKFWGQQSIGGVRVVRSFVIAPDRVHMMKRILYYVSFAVSALFNSLLHVKKTDVIIVISPPLLTGITGVLLKMLTKSKLVFDVGDIWPESAIQLGFLHNKRMIAFLEWLEKWIYRHSDAVNVVTRNTYERFLNIHPTIKNTFYIPNFVDVQSITKIPKNRDLLAALGLTNKIVFGYAGNIGSAQGLTIITGAARRLTARKEIVFLIVGDGIDSASVERDIHEHGLENVILVPPIPKEEIGQYLSLFDYAIIPLVKNDLFHITIPSKMYECMAAEIPILLCVDGEARRVLEEAEAGVFVEPGNAEMLAEKVCLAADDRTGGERMGKNGRAYAQKHFDRETIISGLLKKLHNLPLACEVVATLSYVSTGLVNYV